MGYMMDRSRGMVHVRDILCDMGQRSGTVLFWHRTYVEYISAYVSDIKPTLGPDGLKLLILNDKNLRSFLDAPKEYVEHLIKEIACSYSHSIIQWLAVIIMKILCGTISNLFVTERALQLTLTTMGANPVIFLPTHRSYGDFILMALVCYYYNIQLPCVAAGLDFHSMKGTSYLLRKCKAFFMRRKFADDRTYRTVFQKYFQNLITHGESPVEFFIEGTRSRTNKALVPKFGLLSMALEVFLTQEVADLNIVPVGITYERLIEEHLYVNELLGIPKPKESTSAMFQAYFNMEEDYGKVFFSFGQPISLREWWNTNYSHCPQDSLDYPCITQDLAYTIVNEQVQLQAVLPVHVLAFIMVVENCLYSKCAVPLEYACSRSLFLLMFCERLRVPVSALRDHYGLKLEIIRICKLHSAVIDLEDDIISFKSLSLYKPPNLSNLRRVFVEADVQRLTPIMTIQLYVNPMLHVFLGPAITLVTLKPSNFLKRGSLFSIFVKIANIFKYEFVTLLKDDLQELHSKSLGILKADGIINDRNEYLYSSSFLKDCLKVMLDPFIRGYVNVCATLLQHDKITECELIKQTQILGLKLWKNEEISHPYCISKDLILNCIRSLLELNCINKYERNAIVSYNIVGKKVRELNNFFIWMLKPLPDTMQCQMNT